MLGMISCMNWRGVLRVRFKMCTYMCFDRGLSDSIWGSMEMLKVCITYILFIHLPPCNSLALGASIGTGDDCAASVGRDSMLHPIVFTVLDLL